MNGEDTQGDRDVLVRKGARFMATSFSLESSGESTGGGTRRSSTSVGEPTLAAPGGTVAVALPEASPRIGPSLGQADVLAEDARAEGVSMR